MLNIYCDESCHLENDGIQVMGIGGISCPDYATKLIDSEIKQIKAEYDIPKFREIKWSKVSKGESEYYKELIYYFFQNELLRFRGVLIPDKSVLRHDDFNQTHDDFYYKTYYQLIQYFLRTQDDLTVYIDIKDTISQRKVNKLSEVLYNRTLNMKNSVEKVQQIRSHESSILQLTDLILGAFTYRNRGLDTSDIKLELCEIIEQESRHLLTRSTPLSYEKLNLFIMDLK